MWRFSTAAVRRSRVLTSLDGNDKGIGQI
ncbi:hypothetical protein L195_g063318, partial [Trifolium pratense]